MFVTLTLHVSEYLLWKQKRGSCLTVKPTNKVVLCCVVAVKKKRERLRTTKHHCPIYYKAAKQRSIQCTGSRTKLCIQIMSEAKVVKELLTFAMMHLTFYRFVK